MGWSNEDERTGCFKAEGRALMARVQRTTALAIRCAPTHTVSHGNWLHWPDPWAHGAAMGTDAMMSAG